MRQFLSPLWLAVLIGFSTEVNAQFGYGYTISNDLYHRYTNDGPDDAYKSAGSAILNIGVGPKIWVGGQNFSISAEASATIGFLGLAVKDYKGLGTAAFPMLVNLNFNGLSGMDSEFKMGFSLGGGIQYSKTELYGLSDKYQRQGVDRKLFQTYLVQAAYGFGISGFAGSGYLRYGFHPDNAAKTLSLGLQWDFNIPKRKKRKNPASEL